MKLGPILFIATVLLFVLISQSEAKDIAGKMLPNGATITLTDEPCNLLNPLDGSRLDGRRAYGQYQGETHPACWKIEGGVLYMIWFEADGVTPSGIAEYDPNTFRPPVVL